MHGLACHPDRGQDGQGDHRQHGHQVDCHVEADDQWIAFGLTRWRRHFDRHQQQEDGHADGHQGTGERAHPTQHHALQPERAQQLRWQGSHGAQGADFTRALNDRHGHRIGHDKDDDQTDDETERAEDAVVEVFHGLVEEGLIEPGLHLKRRVVGGNALLRDAGHFHARQEHAKAGNTLRVEQLLRGGNVCVDEAPVHVGNACGKRALDAHVHRVQRPIGGARQQGQAAAGRRLQALGQTLAEHDFRLLGATGEHLAGSHRQKRPLHGKLAVRIDPGGHHDGGLVAIADQPAELDARQDLTHLRVGQQAAAQLGRVVQTVLQGNVFVLVELIGLADDQMPGTARRHLRQTLVGRQRKATGNQNGCRAECGNGHRHQ